MLPFKILRYSQKFLVYLLQKIKVEIQVHRIGTKTLSQVIFLIFPIIFHTFSSLLNIWINLGTFLIEFQFLLQRTSPNLYLEVRKLGFLGLKKG